VGSGGVCTVDDVVEFLSWGLSVQDDAGSAVEAVLDGLDLGVGDVGEAGAFGEVLADQAVGVLVGGALPGAVGVGEVDRDVGGGGEVGVKPGRKRRCGWYDSVIARYASRVNGFTDLFLTKLDVLTGIGEIPICVAYDVDGVRHDEMPVTQSDFHHAVPIYETMPAWDEDISECTIFDELPQKAQDYVRRLEELSGCRISYIGVGPGRDQTIVIHDVMES